MKDHLKVIIFSLCLLLITVWGYVEGTGLTVRPLPALFFGFGALSSLYMAFKERLKDGVKFRGHILIAFSSAGVALMGLREGGKEIVLVLGGISLIFLVMEIILLIRDKKSVQLN